MNRWTILWAIGLASVLAGPWPGSAPARADEDNRTFQERKADRADALRERSRARAEARLGYPNVYGPAAGSPVDYLALSRQIARLAAMIQSLAEPLSAGRAGTPGALAVPPPGLPGSEQVSGMPADVVAVYGPDGPTEASVRLLLEYRLMVAGNPRLRVGEVTAKDAAIIARVVTVDGSLVEEYAVDKRTGLWNPVR